MDLATPLLHITLGTNIMATSHAAAPGNATLTGDPFTQDSASLVVVAAARIHGVDLGYEDVFCLSGNGFSPMVDLSDTCNAWWCVEAWMATPGFEYVLRPYGLELVPVDAPPGTPESELRKARVNAARHAREAGATVLALGGFEWQVQGPKAFLSGKWAGIVETIQPSLVDSYADLTGASLNGRSDNWVADSGHLYALRRIAPGPMSDRERCRTMLRLAVARWHGQAPFRGNDHELYGRRAVDAWISRMESNHGFCEACTRRGKPGCARPNAVMASHGAASAAAYLRKDLTEFPVAAREHLLAAAEHYDQIVSILALFTSDGAYTPILGDLAKQRQHAQAVLIPMRQEYAAAADDLGRALKAMGTGID